MMTKLKTQIVTKLKKMKLSKNLKTLIVTIVIVTEVTVAVPKIIARLKKAARNLLNFELLLHKYQFQFKLCKISKTDYLRNTIFSHIFFCKCLSASQFRFSSSFKPYNVIKVISFFLDLSNFWFCHNGSCVIVVFTNFLWLQLSEVWFFYPSFFCISTIEKTFTPQVLVRLKFCNNMVSLQLKFCHNYRVKKV